MCLVVTVCNVHCTLGLCSVNSVKCAGYTCRVPGDKGDRSSGVCAAATAFTEKPVVRLELELE